jgi:Chemotaxis signal transduction protein
MSQTNILLDAGTNELEIVEFFLDEEGYRGHYGVNVAKVVEIIREQPVTALPQTRHRAVLGAFPHRDGRVVPLVDLSLYLGKNDKRTRDFKIIVTEFNSITMGFLVSGVNRIHRLSWQEVEAPGNFLQSMSSNAITGIVRLEDRVVFILDMEAIVSELDPGQVIRFEGGTAGKIGGGKVYTILHADDSGNVRFLVKRLLEESGRFKVIQASSGEEAWSILSTFQHEAARGGIPVNERVQAVISDIEMPRMDGLTLCRKIKEEPFLNFMPVALFSSLVTDRVGHKGEAVGVDAQFSKPDLQMLSQKVLELIVSGNVKRIPKETRI